MRDVNFNLMSLSLALAIPNALLGTPTENRVVIAVNATSEKRTDSGLFIPNTGEDELPKKGVIVKKGATNDDRVHESLEVGDVVLYGKYGGKEIYPDFEDWFDRDSVKDFKFYVLSSSEIIYIEPNQNS